MMFYLQQTHPLFSILWLKISYKLNFFAYAARSVIQICRLCTVKICRLCQYCLLINVMWMITGILKSFKTMKYIYVYIAANISLLLLRKSVWNVQNFSNTNFQLPMFTYLILYYCMLSCVLRRCLTLILVTMYKNTYKYSIHGKDLNLQKLTHGNN